MPDENYIVFSQDEIEYMLEIVTKYWLKADLRDMARFITTKYPVARYDENGKRLKD